MRTCLFFTAISALFSGFPAIASDTDAELEEKLKAVMILFDKSQQGLNEEIESLQLQVSYLETENEKLTRELEAARRDNLDLKTQLIIQESQGQRTKSANEVIASEEVASNSAVGTSTPQTGGPRGNQRANRGAGPGPGGRQASDGLQVAANAESTVPADDMININTATREELMKLPLANEFLVDGIISGRPWDSIEDLIKLQGVGPMKIRRLQPAAFAGPISENTEESSSENPVD